MDNATLPGNVRDREIERMMLQHGTSIYRVCYAYLRDRQLAEDAGQETFIKAYKNLSTLQDQALAHEKAWLTRIAVNTCKDVRRSAWLRRLDRSVSPEKLLHSASASASEEYSLAEEVLNLGNEKRLLIRLTKTAQPCCK